MGLGAEWHKCEEEARRREEEEKRIGEKKEEGESHWLRIGRKIGE